MRHVLIGLLAFAGCKRASDGASCGAVAGQFYKIASDELAAVKPPQLDDSTRRRVHDQLPAMRDAMDQACSEGAWSRAVRDCIAKAATHKTIVQCEEQLTPAQRATLDKSVDRTPSAAPSAR